MEKKFFDQIIKESGIDEKYLNDYKKSKNPKVLKEYIQYLKNQNIKQEKIIMQLSKKAIFGELLGMIAHQWKQPLNTISVLVQEMFLSLKLKDKENIVEKKVKIELLEQIKFMSHTIDDFRNFFKESKVCVDTNIVSEISNSIIFINNQLSFNSIKLIFYIEDKSFCNNHMKEFTKITSQLQLDYPIKTLPNELKHVFLNVLINSKDQLVLKEISSPKLEITIKKIKNGYKICILDNAEGIQDNNVLKKIWEPYYSTKEDGTGLGLFMSKYILEKSLNGKIKSRNFKNGLLTTIYLSNVRSEICQC